MASNSTEKPAPVDPLIGEEPTLPEPEESPKETAAPDTPEPETPAEEPAAEPETAEVTEPAEPEPVETAPEPGAKPKQPGPWSRLRQLEEERTQQAQALEAMRQEIERLKAPPPPPQEQAKPVTYEEDPLEFLRQQQAMIAQAALTTQQQNQVILLQNQIRTQEEEFSRDHTDYRDALRFLEEREMKRAMAAGYDENGARQIVNARANLLVQSALANKKSVPELAWQVAIAEGWKTPSAEPEAKPAPDPKAKLAASKARTALAQSSVGGVAGGATAHQPIRSRQQLLDLTPAQMEALDRDEPGWEQRLEG